ncbi:UDP-N-acetylmuramoyl-L-alanyl-D-glutamate--2,6-diaminopimelate ligase [Thauera sp. Sel9]|uniref:UDP-N-acetylmuramoyl-L-alanyl-D-glutamate--2, 6-diaminopimelate ligase n=1 Tax=Thauera sp. Sel9 TaxID=2974299 RepID=UPI0021E15650|nr:UDP-N-acetylmuramoyl-L-alanyl-D-glutamate--2,6-diaminopimelate ligase [Thauera sp. Sel9]MCV2218376.1 UDP-N-acetylmuramoyl-L-alanyl-D-glutamate--2,6-diaminopimelate ligase [Thauera sp. Sel9]
MGKVASILACLRAAGVQPAGITADSRKLGVGEVFAAWPGFRTDGRRYLASAIEGGAAAVLWESVDGFNPGHLPVPSLPVEGLRELAGHLAHEIYGHPSEQLWLAGVTGTNGKTTVSQMLAAALQGLGTRCGIVGTLGNGFPGELESALNTTPDALELHRLLAGFVAAGAGAAVMEVSSIGLDQGRVNGACFDAVIFTNLSRDHLDYHGSMEVYGDAKARLFALGSSATAIINIDDPFGLMLARRLAGEGREVIACTLYQANVDAVPGARVLFADRLQSSATGFRFALQWDGRTADVQVRVVGHFNVSNLLLVAAALLVHGLPFDELAPHLARLQPPEGRMQLVGGVCEPLIVIDYAHTPDALAQVLESLRPTVRSRQGRLVCVFGCGGDRDPGKRPLMGEVARQLADRVIVTSDNPRTEDPQKILEAVAAGAGPAAEHIVDRARAIGFAVAEAAADDVVVIAGKGHEPYQEIHGRRLPFSDLEQADLALRAWHARGAQR